MWPFRKQTSDELVRRVADLERRQSAIEAEWEDWFNKFRSLYARLNRRADREVERAEKEAEGAKPNGGLAPVTNPLALELLRSGR